MASTWVKLYDDFFDHPKAHDLPPTAVTIFLRAICYSSKHLTDGRVPLSVICSWGYARWRHSLDTLSTCSLVTMSEECIQIHDYLDYQRSAEEARNIRAKRASAGAKGGQAKAAKAKQTPSKVLDGGLAEKRREDSPSSPPQISGEKPAETVAYGDDEELTRAALAHMAQCDLDRARAEGTVITNQAAWLRKAAETRGENHATAIAYEIERRTASEVYPLHVEIAEAVDPRCGPDDGGALRARLRADRAAAEASARADELEHIRSNPDAIKAGAAAARAALRTPAA